MALKGAIRASSISHEVDLISSLPDDVLIHILSFLSTKYSVATRILSTRWKHLFASLPVLDFDYSLTSNPSVHTTKTFLKFVKWVLRSHNFHPIIKFRFHFNAINIKESDMDKCVSKVLRRGVREIDINVNFLNMHVLPFSSCETLEILTLGGRSLSIPDSVRLPCLKSLRISRTYFYKSTQRLISSCHMLEDLLLSNCRWDMQVVDISIPTLKRLRIDNLKCNTLFLNVPLLERFDYVSSVRICGESLKSLRGAILSPSGCYNLVSLTKLLEKVCNAHHLYLSSNVLGHFGCYNISFPIFPCLARLELGPVPSVSFGLLKRLLETSANLQVLVFSKGFLDENASNGWFLPEVAPLHLRVIEFREFSMLDTECKFVKYFLEYAKLLDKMVIKPSAS